MDSVDVMRAIRWYTVGNDLVTIAQHFGVTVEELKQYMRKGL